MKTIYYKTIICLLLAVFAFSCEDYLTENPPSEISLVNITEETLEGLIVGVYEPLTRSRGRIWETNFLIALTLMEESSRGGNAGLDRQSLYQFSIASTNYWAAWPTLYQAVGRANLLIADLETNESISEPLKQQAIGEASYVRAMVYYNLVRAWGEVPLRLEPVTDSDNTDLPKESVDVIYEQIINDLQTAESNLAPTTANPGRATSGAAKVALADVYLTRGSFSLARDKAKEVIDNASTYGYALIDSYPELFSPTADTNSEDVFSLKFSQAVGLGNFITTNFAPDTPNTLARDAGIAARGLARTGPNSTAPLIANWDDNDLRKSWNTYNTVIIDGQVVNVPPEANFDLFYGKYRDPGAVEETAAGNDFYFHRYADALLIFAEAENQVNGPTALAYDAVNQVRRRAYGVDRNTPNPISDFPAGLGQTEFDDLVFQERGYEFMAEGKRWFDLLRTGRWETLIPAAGKPLPEALVWRFPDSEIQTNDLID